MKAHLLDLYAYDLWANKRILDTILNHGIQDDKVSRWLNHMINAEKLWLERIQTGRFQTMPWEEFSMEALVERIQATHQDIVTWLGNLSAIELENGIASYSNTKGEAFQTPWIGILTHVVNHSTHHRGQVAARIRELGFTPPATDYILYIRES